jgi:hypothetical protein
MTLAENSPGLAWLKRVFRPDFIGFGVVTLVFWIVLLYATGHSVTEHSPHDQYTVQALAWSHGRITMDSPGDERAEYKGKVYISFPPVPSFIELPFVLMFGGKTPNTITLLLFILEKLTGNRALSFFASFSFFWGSQALYLSLFGAVWHQGQLFGVFFAVCALLVLLYARKPLALIAGGFFLGLAVGCRPYYLVMVVFYAYWAYRRFPGMSALMYVAAGLIPPGIFYAIYNFVRFGSILEFGHKYLEHYQVQQDRILELKFFCRNLYHALVNPPEWSTKLGMIVFHGKNDGGFGTGLLFVSPMLLSGFIYFMRRGIGIPEKIASAISVFGIWFLLLLHDTNGWFQFGYRFSVDLMPLLLFFFGRTFTKDRSYLVSARACLAIGDRDSKILTHFYLVLISVYSVIVNIYGSFWYYLYSIFSV